MDSIFEKWWSGVHAGKSDKSKYLAKQAWVMAMKCTLVNMCDEMKIRKELEKINYKGATRTRVSSLRFLKEIKNQ